MKKGIFNLFILCFLSITSLTGQAIDNDLEPASESIINQLITGNKKSISIVDFTNPNGDVSELGRSLSNRIRINIAKKTRDIKIVNRDVLANVLAEEKLFKDGLIDPETAKKIKFKGVDILIMGEIIDYGNNYSIEIQLIDTETSDMIGGEILDIVKSENLTNLSNNVLYNVKDGQQYSKNTIPKGNSSGNNKLLLKETREFIKEIGTHDFEVDVKAGQVIQIEANPVGSDLNLRLTVLNPKGQVVYYEENWTTKQGNKNVSYKSGILGANGKYKVQIFNWYRYPKGRVPMGAGVGQYEITITATDKK